MKSAGDCSIVYLVGAGPGDPELLTCKARRLITEADVVVYDRLVSDEILALIPAGTARFSVGKQPGFHPVCQENINALLVMLAKGNRCVVRLKGGDPLLFGRGSEEIAALASAGISCEVVPGVTSASACAASVGVPLTHRGMASSVRFVTGHCRADAELDFDWRGLADPDTTLVVYMGFANIERIASRVMAHGLDPATPFVPGAAEEIGPSRASELAYLIRQDCGSCHGMTLKGGLGAPLLPEMLADKHEDALAAIILDGMPGTPMPPWRPLLTDAEAAWIVRALKEGLP